MTLIKCLSILIAFGAVGVFGKASPSLAATLLFTDEASWHTSVTNVESFKFTSANISTSSEVAVPPFGETNLGTRVLTFNAVNTGLSRGFTLTAVNPGHNWVFEDRNLTETLSPGDIDLPELENDDMEIAGFTGPALTAFSLNVLGNDIAEGPESFSVFGSGDVLLASIPLPINSGSQFLGVVSDVAITRILVDEAGARDEDIVVESIRNASLPTRVPEPATILGTVAATGLGILFTKKKAGASNIKR